MSQHDACCRRSDDYGSRGWGFESSWAHEAERLSSLRQIGGCESGCALHVIRRHHRFNSHIRSPNNGRPLNCVSPAVPVVVQAYLAVMRNSWTTSSGRPPASRHALRCILEHQARCRFGDQTLHSQQIAVWRGVPARDVLARHKHARNRRTYGRKSLGIDAMGNRANTPNMGSDGD